MSQQTILSNLDVTLITEQENNFLQLTWHQQPTAQLFRETYLTLLQNTLDQNLTYWICDMRNMYFLEVGEQNWLVQDIFGALNKALTYKLAYVVSSEGLELMTSYRIIEMVKSNPALEATIKIETFFELPSAKRWLFNK